MEFTRERLIIIIASSIAIVTLGVYIFLYRPLIGKLRVTSLECRAIETETSRVREEIATLEAIEVKKVLITEEDVSLAIDELTRFGKLKGINFLSMTPKNIETSDTLDCRTLPIEMEIESTYEGFGVFMGSLDKLKKSLVTVRHFNIVPDKENAARLHTRLVVNMHLAGR